MGKGHIGTGPTRMSSRVQKRATGITVYNRSVMACSDIAVCSMPDISLLYMHVN